MGFVNAIAPAYYSNSVDEWLALQPETSVLRFVGRTPRSLLTAEGRETLVGELPANAREALGGWLLSGMSMLGNRMDAAHPFGHITDVEPSEALPGGIPADTRVRFRWTTAHFVMQRRDGFPMMLSSAEGLSYLLRSNNQNAHFDSANGRALQVEVIFAYGRKVTHVIRETPDYMTTERNWRKLSELPNEVLEVMRAEERRIEALGTRVNIGGTPPPAR